MTKENIEALLQEVVHPESGLDVVALQMVDHIQIEADKIQVTLSFAKARDPFARSLKRACMERLESAYPHLKGHIQVFIKEAAAKPKPAPVEKTPTQVAPTVLAISSAKGGVGKSTVTANLAATLAREGYRVGVLDADIYGPSQPLLFGLQGYQPAGETIDGREMIIPAQALGVKVMSIGFFIDPNDALVWRGPMATNALRQMIHQTAWGALDFLLLDLPPGTGDVHLSLISELTITAAVVVSTPQKMALADVVRGVAMFRGEKVAIPVLGLVENMAWFTPAEEPDRRYYIFGKGGATRLAEELNIPVLGEIPLVQGAGESADSASSVIVDNSITAPYYSSIVQQIKQKLTQLGH